MKNTELTQIIIDCQSWVELKDTINKNAPFISYSRESSKEWSAEALLRNMELVRNGYPLNLITRVNGLRSKVSELILAENYGAPWE